MPLKTGTRLFLPCGLFSDDPDAFSFEAVEEKM
jgi:hypothetical protein